ncbi:MAG: Lrp/AsnC family transcriptional regulator [Thaumarchaeota archaeon]|jgi:DNA-binding Lrp family transcriptional regulator|nr:Lrp/AsnC family transcriptional regulator [Nitrososphaerota archaeon]MDG6994498.1 Lrp/AsnC family transcriptional regulator [Nitrososphaerota archaeon]MDG6998731.1 Lrp/AsnC family transcriptional regulator [Nitrososphaerota archaeon]
MTVAFVLITCNIGYEKQLVVEIKMIEGVSEVHAVYGSYDIIAKIEAGTSDQIRKIVFSEIRKLDNVRSTLTLIANQ